LDPFNRDYIVHNLFRVFCWWNTYPW